MQTPANPFSQEKLDPEAEDVELNFDNLATMQYASFWSFFFMLTSRNYKRLVGKLYNPAAPQCAQCGVRFGEKTVVAAHLDWHFRKNKRESVCSLLVYDPHN